MERDIINVHYEKEYNVKCKWSGGTYENMDVQSIFLIFRSGWLSRMNHDEIKREKHSQLKHHRRWNDYKGD